MIKSLLMSYRKSQNLRKSKLEREKKSIKLNKKESMKKFWPWKTLKRKRSSKRELKSLRHGTKKEMKKIKLRWKLIPKKTV